MRIFLQIYRITIPILIARYKMYKEDAMIISNKIPLHLDSIHASKDWHLYVNEVGAGRESGTVDSVRKRKEEESSPRVH